MDAADAMQLADLRALADGLSTDDPEVRRFAESALAYIESLGARIEDDDHRRRMGDLVIEQAESISRLQATLDRICALRDLAEWSAESTGSDPEEAVVRLSDLTRALHPAD